MFYGGNGTIGSVPTDYLFPGNPNNLSEWSETSNANSPGDRRGVMTLEAENLAMGDFLCNDFAILYSRQVGNNHLQNVNSLIALASTAKNDFDAMTAYN